MRAIGTAGAVDAPPLTASAIPLRSPSPVIRVLGRVAMPRISAAGFGKPERPL